MSVVIPRVTTQFHLFFCLLLILLRLHWFPTRINWCVDKYTTDRKPGADKMRNSPAESFPQRSHTRALNDDGSKHTLTSSTTKRWTTTTKIRCWPSIQWCRKSITATTVGTKPNRQTHTRDRQISSSKKKKRINFVNNNKKPESTEWKWSGRFEEHKIRFSSSRTSATYTMFIYTPQQHSTTELITLDQILKHILSQWADRVRILIAYGRIAYSGLFDL